MSNIYLELELFLDPAVIDPMALENELKSKLIPDWNKKVNANAKYKVFTEKAKKYMDGGLATLGLEGLAFDAISKQFAELDHAITEYERDGILEDGEFKQLLSRFPCFKEATIKSRLHLEITEGFKPPEKPKSLDEEGLPLPKMEAIAANLSHIADGQYKDLYQLLGMSNASTTEALLNATKEANNKNMKVTTKTAEVGAKNSVFGEALVIFKDDTSRKKYDIALRRRSFDKLCLKTFDLRAHGKTVSTGDYELSIKDAQQCGYNAAETEWMVYDYYVNKKKCDPPKLKIERKPVQQCAACFHLNDINAKVCSYCGVPLKIKCPKCNVESAFGTGYCQCGFAIGDMANAVTSVKSAKKCLEDKKIDEAKALLRTALIYWQGYSEAIELRKHIDAIEKEIAEQKKIDQAAADRRRREAAAVESKIRDLFAKKRFFEAEKELGNLKAIYPDSPLLQNEGKQIEDTLKIVRNDLAKLPNCKTTQDKIDLCEGIIEKTIDCYEARQALENFPPLSPSHLTVKELPMSFQLSWTPPQSKRPPQFVIVRKEGGVPVSPQDGKQITKNLEASTFTDSTAAIGTIYGYAVYSQRGEQFDAVGCKTKLLQLVGEVQNLQAMPNDSSVTLTWTPFSHDTVKVFRYTGNSVEGAAQEIYAQKPGVLRDSGLTNGQVYTYKVQAVFKSPDDNEIKSNGKIVSCKPALPPPQVNDLKAETQPNGDVLFTWTPPANGTLYLFVTKENPPPTGDVLQNSVTELTKRFGEPISLAEKNSTNWHSTEGGICYVIPITYQDSIAVIGTSVSVTKIDSVKNLRLHNSGTQWHLRWDWSNGIDQVLLVYRSDKTPNEKNDPAAVRKIIKRSEYEREDAVSFSAGQDYYFAVYSLLEQEGNLKVSKPVYRQTVKTIIRYSLSFRKSTSGEPEGMLQINAENADVLPALIIKKMNERIPLNRNEGTQIASIAATARKSGSMLIPKKHFEEDSYIRLFVKDAEESPLYKVIDPPQKKLELLQQ